MKKLFYTLGAALVMLSSVSCKKDNPKEEQPTREMVDMVFYAASNGTEKTTVKTDGKTVIWNEGDAIMVYPNGCKPGSAVCTLTDGAGTTYAEFSGQSTQTGPWIAIYPASKAIDGDDGVITFSMIEAQTYDVNTFAQGAMPCVTFSETTEFMFKHSFGVLKLQLKGEGSVKSIKVTDKGGTKLNGTFKVMPYYSEVALKKGDDGTSSVILNCGDSGVELSASKATAFWIVVPEGAFASGFDLEVTSTDNKKFEKSTTNAQTITAGQIKPMAEITVEFAGEIFDAYDRCGNGYHEVTIGSQVWLKENVRCNLYDTESEAYKAGRTGTLAEAPDVLEDDDFTPTYYDISDKVYYMGERELTKNLTPELRAILGYMYNGVSALGFTAEEALAAKGTQIRQGICPNGYRIPTKADFDILINNCGGEDVAGQHLMSDVGWFSEPGVFEPVGDNTSGFYVLPTGFFEGKKEYRPGIVAAFFTSQINVKSEGTEILWYDMFGSDPGLDTDDEALNESCAVRCIKAESSATSGSVESFQFQ